MDWEYMVVKRYYRDGIYEARIIARKDFNREDFPAVSYTHLDVYKRQQASFHDCRRPFYGMLGAQARADPD